jgi:homoserine O-succinyltransferase
MPIKISRQLPAFEILEKKGVFVMDTGRAETQDIRPLKIGIYNLMPTKEQTEAQLLRVLGNGPLQIEPVFIRTGDYQPKNTSQNHLDSFYVSFADVRHSGLDGLIITGAPVENMEFAEVAYWQELTELMDWGKEFVTSTLHLCWGAQAGLYHHYGIGKYPLPQKCSGIFPHIHADCPILFRGMDDVFFAPHSRHTDVRKEDVLKEPDLEILAESAEAGLLIVANKSRSLIFDFGHMEYDRTTIADEYFRDLQKGLNPEIPKNYFPHDDPQKVPQLMWRANAEMFFRNWVNFVYQETPYALPHQ